MENRVFADLIRSLPTRSSRRRFSTAAAGGLVAGLTTARLRPAGDGGAVAKRRKKRGRNKNKKRQPASGTQPAPGAPALAPKPPPSPPTGPGECSEINGVGYTGSKRWAQTFLPPRAGQVASATFFLFANVENYYLKVEIRTVDATGVPSGTILAGSAIDRIPRTEIGDPPTRITATFAEMDPLVLGERYALVITGEPFAGDDYAIYVNDGGNSCPDGTFFWDPAATDEYIKLASEDLIYELDLAG